MKIVVVGATGQLGTDVSIVFREGGNEVIELGHDEIEIDKIDSVRNLFGEIKPEIVINTAAYHNVEECEKNPLHSYEVNAIGARNLAIASRENNFYLVHISTDYVFDGKKKAPYIETDPAFPLNYYGNAKLAGELFVQAENDKALVMRVSGLYGKHPCRAKGLNFVDLMIKLGTEREEVRVVDNEVLTPTSTLEVARQVKKVSEHPVYGLCHATAEGQCSWYDFAKEIFRIKNLKATLNVADPGEFPVKVPRPEYSVLENKVLKENQINILQSWQEGLAEYLG